MCTAQLGNDIQCASSLMNMITAPVLRIPSAVEVKMTTPMIPHSFTGPSSYNVVSVVEYQTSAVNVLCILHKYVTDI